MSEKLRLAVIETGSENPEIFGTLQGEGRHTGEPATFVRLSGCNLCCKYCDTPQTWLFEGVEPDSPHKDNVVYDKAAEVVAWDIETVAQSVLEQPAQRAVITGGEPLLQQRNIALLINRLRMTNPWFQVEVETNGTIVPNNELSERVNQFNVSPKLSGAGMPITKTIRPKAMEWFADCEKADFKFVITDPLDIAETQMLTREYDIPQNRIYFMTEGRTLEELEDKEHWVAQEAMRLGVNFSDRLHIKLFGSGRGV